MPPVLWQTACRHAAQVLSSGAAASGTGNRASLVDIEHAVMTGANQCIVSLVVHNSTGEVSTDLRICDQLAIRRADGNAGILVVG